jgi:dTDP-4-dehydrorhamnose reductase
MMGPILVTGGAGQLATALVQEGGAAIHRVGRPDFDFDRSETLAAVFQAVRPALLVNAAAWTGVDTAEAEPDAAGRANRDGPATLAALCADAGIPMIHVSTDYVFDGSKGTPYIESDPTSPTGVYGRTKLEGEQAVLAACPRAVVLRTSWVYSAAGKNFVRTMLGAAQKVPRLRVVADQRGCPTAARDLAVAILAIAPQLADARPDGSGTRVPNGSGTRVPNGSGVFHACGGGETTWHGLATAVFQEAARHGHPVPAVDAIATADWPTPARRPPDSRLDCTKLARVFGVRLPDWRTSLARTVDELLAPAASPG